MVISDSALTHATRLSLFALSGPLADLLRHRNARAGAARLVALCRLCSSAAHHAAACALAPLASARPLRAAGCGPASLGRAGEGGGELAGEFNRAPRAGVRLRVQ